MRLLITGGTGSLGQAILKQQEILKQNEISRIIIFSRDEQKQEQLEQNYKGDIELQCVLGDVKDKERLYWTLESADYVIHAAAYKILTKFEYDVLEGFEVNINGTMNVIRGILRAKKCLSAVFVSTDKSVDPINSYGVSKLAAEKAWLWANQVQNNTAFAVSKYGNVFCSRGSAPEKWLKAQVNKEPIILHSPSATRFFISLNEASKFVLDALFNNQKKVMIPEMKSTEMIRLARLFQGEIKVTGLKPGEKEHESLTSVNDPIQIRSDLAPRFSINELEELLKEWEDEHGYSFDRGERINRFSLRFNS